MPKILLVCSANVCRSQYARIVLREALALHDSLGPYTVQCAGTRVPADAEVCDTVQHLVEAGGGDSALHHPTKPRALDLRLVESADLILTAERSHRSAVARLLPQARPKTFTLLEAAQYARLTAGELRERGGEFAFSVDRFRSWVSVLNSGRGRVPIVESLTERRPFRRAIHRSLLDIEDGHNMSLRRHRATLELIAQSVTEFVGSLATELTTAD